MATTMNIQEAKTHLSALIALAERGEVVHIARSGRPVVRLAPVNDVPRRTFGTMTLPLPDAFFDPLPDAELDAWQ